MFVQYSAAIIPHLLSERPMRTPCLGVDNLVKTCARSRSQEIDSKSWGGSVPKSLQCRAFQSTDSLDTLQEEEFIMCGIVGAIALRNVTPILLEGLNRLEYRGYDSAGLAVLDDAGQLQRPGP